MREAYETWFKEKFGFPPMPIHSRVMDFCWEGYQAGVESMRRELAEMKVRTKGRRAYRFDIFPDD